MPPFSNRFGIERGPRDLNPLARGKLRAIETTLAKIAKAVRANAEGLPREIQNHLAIARLELIEAQKLTGRHRQRPKTISGKADAKNKSVPILGPSKLI